MTNAEPRVGRARGREGSREISIAPCRPDERSDIQGSFSAEKVFPDIVSLIRAMRGSTASTARPSRHLPQAALHQARPPAATTISRSSDWCGRRSRHCSRRDDRSEAKAASSGDASSITAPFPIRLHFVREERIASAQISAGRFLTTRLLAPMSALSATHNRAPAAAPASSRPAVGYPSPPRAPTYSPPRHDPRRSCAG